MGAATRTHSGHAFALGSVTAPTIRVTDTRSAGPSAALSRDTSWALVDLERYEVRVGPRVAGFVDVVGHVFVALTGDRYDRAVEVTQSLRFDAAISAVVADFGREATVG